MRGESDLKNFISLSIYQNYCHAAAAKEIAFAISGFNFRLPTNKIKIIENQDETKTQIVNQILEFEIYVCNHVNL